MKLQIEKGMVDWFTMTSYEHDSFGHWLHEQSKIDGKIDEDKSMMQYDGRQVTRNNHGHCFVGSGQQQNRWHTIIRAGGEISSILAESCCFLPKRAGWARCTRIDLQVTAWAPEGWTQWTLLNRLKRGKRVASIITSLGYGNRDFSTVYCGSMKSARFSRTYVKDYAKDGRMLLRHECVFQRDLADSICRTIAKADDRQSAIDAQILNELQRMGDTRLEALFAPFLHGNGDASPKLRVIETTLDSKKNWLLGSVLPAFERYINDHDSDPIVGETFFRLAMERYPELMDYAKSGELL